MYIEVEIHILKCTSSFLTIRAPIAGSYASFLTKKKIFDKLVFICCSYIKNFYNPNSLIEKE